MHLLNTLCIVTSGVSRAKSPDAWFLLAQLLRNWTANVVPDDFLNDAASLGESIIGNVAA